MPASTLHPIALPVSELLHGEEGSTILNSAIIGMLQTIANESPTADIQIVAPDAKDNIGRNVNDLIYATITLDPADIIVIDNAITSRTQQHVTTVFIPLYLIRARDGTVLYARTQIIEIPFESAMLTDNAEARTRFYAALKRAFDPSHPPTRAHMDGIATALERGSFRSPTSITYGINAEDIRLTGALAEGEHRFSNIAQMRRFFQKFVEANSSHTFLVIASPHAQPTRKQIGDVAVNTYNLQVFTDLGNSSGIAFERNGRYFLPLNLPEPDYLLSLDLSLAVNEQQSQRFHKSGEYKCYATLSERLLASGETIDSSPLSSSHLYTIATQAKVTPHALKHMVALVQEQIKRKKE